MTIKKLSKQSIVVAILSIALSVAVVFGATAAWFTAKDSAEVSVTTGKISLIITERDGADWGETSVTAVIVPGDTVIPAGLKVKSDPNDLTTIDTYIRITVKSTSTGGFTLTALNSDNWIVVDKEGDTTTKYYYYKAIGKTEPTAVSATDLQNGLGLWADAAIIPTDVGNNSMGQEITITITAEAIQAKHIDATTADINTALDSIVI